MEFEHELKVELIQSWGSDEMVARAARVSTGTDLLKSDKIEGLIKYLMKNGHCYDPETEILTRDRGWIKFPEVTYEDEVLTRTTEGEMSWSKPLHIIEKPYSGDLIKFSGRNLDLMVTPDHRMFARHRTREGWQDYGIHLAKEFQDRAYKIPRGGGVMRGVEVPDTEARLLGFVLADAHVGKTSISFHLTKTRKIQWLKELLGDALLGGQGNTYRIPLKWSPELSRLSKLTYDKDRNRVIPDEVLKTWGTSSLKAFLEGYLEGDGHSSPEGRVSAATVSETLANQLQVLAALSGGAATVNGPFDYGKRGVESGFSKSHKPIYNVHFSSDRHLDVRVGWTLRDRERQIEYVPYVGTVHCVTVPSGIILVRRNGMTAWCGNSSPLEHSGATFRLEVPLFVRDQIVRHRTFSYNIKSFRFGEADPVFYDPPANRPLTNEGSGAHPKLSLANNARLYSKVSLAHRFEAISSWEKYRELMHAGVAEEVARGVLPANIYTQMYMSGNLWNWMQFLDKRIESEHNKPQWEVERVAKRIEAEMFGLFPVSMGAWELGRRND